MPSPRAALCAAIVLLCTGAVAQPTSSRPPSGTPKPAPASVASQDLFEVMDAATQQSARGVVAFVCSSRLTLNGDGTYALLMSPFVPPPTSASQNVCADEPFRTQQVAAVCSGVLVTSTVVATSAPCLKLAQSECGGPFAGAQAKVRAVFGLAMKNASTPPLVIPGADVAIPKRIVKQTTGLANNWALLELDRTVAGRAVPLSTSKPGGGSVRVIGHPQGLPAKVSAPVLLDSSAASSFTVSTSTVGYGSGAPAFNLTGSPSIAGLVVSDPVSWSCSGTNACCKTAPIPGQGTSATLIRGTALASAVCTPKALCGTACVDTSIDPNNCGKCDNVCALANTTSTCRAGGCRIGACTTGYADCDRVSGNGCETQLGTVDNCSACNDTCKPLPNAIAACNGTCQYTCKAGYADCDAIPGCETKGSCLPTCTDAGCDDGNACTNDFCNSSNQCAHSPKTSGTSCNDNNACTTGDVCNGSGTCGGTAVSCNSPPNQCYLSAGTCSNGTCSYSLKPAGAYCDDNNACTTGDVCNGSGVCGGTAISCNSPPNQCYASAGTCSNGTCSYSPKPSGTACNDGQDCTAGDVCNGNGACAGTPFSCNNPPGQCYASSGSCNPNGTCSYSPKSAGAPCDDLNSCTTGDSCNGVGQCSPGLQTCTGITSIRVSGPGTGGGGGNITGWHLVSSDGADQGQISVGISQPLYFSIDWLVTLGSLNNDAGSTLPIQPNSYFALSSSEGSSTIPRTFEFYGPGNTLINSITVVNSTLNIVRYFNASYPGGDEFTRFFFDGHTVTSTQVTVPP